MIQNMGGSRAAVRAIERPRGRVRATLALACLFFAVALSADASAQTPFGDVAGAGTTITEWPDDPTKLTTASFEFESEDGNPDAQFLCSLDGESAESFAPCASPQIYPDVGEPGLAAGGHTFRVRTDGVLFDGPPAEYPWTIDTQPPVTNVFEGIADGTVTNETSASFTFGSEEGATLECKLDDDFWEQDCSSPREYSGLGEGDHTLRVRATDAAGNVETAPPARGWTIDLTPPTVTIEAQPPALVSSADATFQFSSPDDNEAQFGCSLDGAAFDTCSSPQQYTGLSDSEHTFALRAADRAGNLSDPVSRAWTIDTEPPVTDITAGFADGAITSETSASFAFGSEAGTSFECKLNVDPWEPNCPAPREYTGLGEGEHTFRVRATDAAGNVEQAPPARSWTIDTQPPVTAVSEGIADGTVTNKTTASFTFSSEDGATLECKLDSAPWEQDCPSPRSYAGLGEGEHTFRARATDVAGNIETAPPVRQWEIDTTPPTTRIDAQPPPLVASSSARFEFSAPDEASPAFECRLDSEEELDFEGCSSPMEYTLEDGRHDFYVRAKDPLGNTEASAKTVTWTIDTKPPVTDISVGIENGTVTKETSASFTFSSEDGATLECKLDSAPWEQDCPSPREYTGLGEGEHTLRVRATDAAGNVEIDPPVRHWTIDLTAPSLALAQRPPAYSNSTAAAFAFDSDDPDASFGCALDDAASVPCESPVDYDDLTDGEHAFRVTDRDGAGNSSAMTARWVVDTAPPATAIDDGIEEGGVSEQRAQTFRFSSSEEHSNFECRLDSEDEADYDSCDSPHTTEGLADGNHVFDVRATDLAGNVDPSPALRAFAIEGPVEDPPPAQPSQPGGGVPPLDEEALDETPNRQAPGPTPHPSPGSGSRPNIVAIMVDDQALNTFKARYMPQTFRLLVRKGTLFTGGVATSPLCCPSRASFQTGQYAHNHGVVKNDYALFRDRVNVISSWLQRAGYRTGLIGKYMNGYSRVAGHAPAPGYDYWWAFHPRPKYYNYRASVNGHVRHFGRDRTQYASNVVTRQGVRFIRDAAGSTRPFFLWLSHWAPHLWSTPGAGAGNCARQAAAPLPADWKRWRREPLPQPGNFNQLDVAVTGPKVSGLPSLRPRAVSAIRTRFRCAVAAMQAVDRSLASVMQALRRAGVEDDTVVVYLSDQGFYFGEHRIALGKTKPYAESVRVPMVARIPRTILGRRARPVVRETVANIDLAPTFLDLAGATPCAAPDSCIVPDGRSLLPLVSGVSSESFVDRAVLVELGWPCESYNAYWSNDEAYVEWFADQSEGASPCEIGWRELYDLRGDPLQITNLLDLHEARYGARSSEGPDERLHALMECEGTTGPRACE